MNIVTLTRHVCLYQAIAARHSLTVWAGIT